MTFHENNSDFLCNLFHKLIFFCLELVYWNGSPPTHLKWSWFIIYMLRNEFFLYFFILRVTKIWLLCIDISFWDSLWFIYVTLGMVRFIKHFSSSGSHYSLYDLNIENYTEVLKRIFLWMCSITSLYIYDCHCADVEDRGQVWCQSLLSALFEAECRVLCVFACTCVSMCKHMCGWASQANWPESLRGYSCLYFPSHQRNIGMHANIFGSTWVLGLSA